MNWRSIIANFQTFNLADLLDVLVVTFVIYQILGIVSRTRAGQLARGALVVALIYVIATTSNMRTVTWIMDSLLQVGLLTLVVVFQPELRRALGGWARPTSGSSSFSGSAMWTPPPGAAGAAPSSPSATRPSAFPRPRPAP